MDVSKIISQRIKKCVFLLVIFGLLFLLFGSFEALDYFFIFASAESVSNDFHVIYQLAFQGIFVYLFSQLIANIIFKAKSYNNICVMNTVAALCFFILTLPLTIFIFASKNAGTFMLVLYSLLVIAIPLFGFIKTGKKANEVWFVCCGFIALFLKCGVPEHYEAPTDINTYPAYIEYNKLIPNAKLSAAYGADCQNGTLGSLVKYKIYLKTDNEENDYYLDYFQFESDYEFVLNKIKKQHFPENASTTVKDDVTLLTDGNHTYFLEFENAMIVLETDADISENVLFSAIKQ